MRQSLSTVLPRSAKEAIPPRHYRPPVVERIAGWSTRHRKTVVFGWLLLVVALFAVGHALGTKSVPGYDAGQAGQAERTLHQLTSNASAPATESVLIQEHTVSSDAELRSAARQVVSALTALPTAAADVSSPRRSADGHSLLVTFSVPGNQNNASTTVEPDQRASRRSRPGIPA